jgi:membrane protease subunit HflK
LTGARQDIELKARKLIQEILDEYGAGIEITGIQLQDVKPPATVIDGCPAGAAVE